MKLTEQYPSYDEEDNREGSQHCEGLLKRDQNKMLNIILFLTVNLFLRKSI